MKYYVGIDLGGTNIVAGVVDEEYNIVAKASTKTNCPRPAKEIADDMAKMAIQAVENANLTMEQIEWIGIGTPGIANSETGIIEYSNNLGFKDTPMVEYIRETIDKPVFIENDANAAAYGEFVAGAAKGAKNAVCITLGTGVGGGIIIDGKIYSGSNFAGAEIGHTVIEVDGAQCSCGRKGCFEAYSSATGLIRMTNEAIAEHPDSIMAEMAKTAKVTARTSFDAMRDGDEYAKVVVDKYKANPKLPAALLEKASGYPFYNTSEFTLARLLNDSDNIAENFVSYIESFSANVQTIFNNLDFKKQIEKGGPVTVAHPDIIRFFMLIPEACALVLEAGTMGHGGEVFVFDMGQPVKIVDLAKKLIQNSGRRDVKIQYTGLRKGEKLYEEVLIKGEEEELLTDNEKIRIAKVHPYEYEEVCRHLDELMEIGKTYDDMNIVRKMKEIVPEFKSNNSRYEILDK